MSQTWWRLASLANVKFNWPTPSALLSRLVLVDTFGTGKVSSNELVRIIRETFDLRPKGIIDMLNLKRPIYEATLLTAISGASRSATEPSVGKNWKNHQLAKLAAINCGCSLNWKS
jgi:S-adenosylmethionine synthetase